MISDMKQNDEFWWRDGVFYQIYPRSFQDSNADGVGDIAGIIDRLPYLLALGVDAIWLSPIYASPMADFGYDIADYTGIDALFGTMADFDALVDAAHSSDLKLILDLVPNHTSDLHPWFAESRAAPLRSRPPAGRRVSAGAQKVLQSGDPSRPVKMRAPGITAACSG